MLDDPPVATLIVAAAQGDQRAWDALVDRYAGLVWSTARGYRLGDSDAEDVCQTVWLRLVEQLGSLREPQALPGWLVTTTRRECLRVLRLAQRARPTDDPQELDLADDPDRTAADRDLLAGERAEALREAFASLPQHCRALLHLLVADPPPAYSEVSTRLHIPVGSIGPTRSRCLDKLRHCPALAGLLETEAAQAYTRNR